MSDAAGLHYEADGSSRPLTDDEIQGREAAEAARLQALANAPRLATASQLYAVMTDAQTAAWDKALGGMKRAYGAYWDGGYRDPMPETNPKLAKIAKAAGLDLKALYDAAVPAA